MSLIRVIPIVFSSLFLLSACGGGGSSGGSSGGSDSKSSQISSTAVSSQSTPTWKDSGTLDDPLIVSEDDSTGAQAIDRIKENSESVNLTPTMPLRGRIAQVSISPDSTKVAYLADQETDNRFELFVSNSMGTVNLKVSAPFELGDVRDFKWSDDSNYIIYRLGFDTQDSKYYVAKFDGSKSSEITYKSDASQNLKLITSPEFIPGSNQYRFIVGNTTEKRLVTANPVTRDITSDVSLILNGTYVSAKDKYLVSQTKETLGDSQLFITDLTNNQTTEIYSGGTLVPIWSNRSNKIALFNFKNLTIYNADEKSFLSLMNYEPDEINSISWRNYWYMDDKYLVFETSGRGDDVLIVPTNGTTPIRFREFLGHMESINSLDISSDNKLLVLTDAKRVMTMNMDGTTLTDHTWLQSEVSLSRGLWLPDNTSAIAQQYNYNTNKNVLIKIDFQNLTVTNLSGNKTVNCFLVAKSTKSQCVMFFDER